MSLKYTLADHMRDKAKAQVEPKAGAAFLSAGSEPATPATPAQQAPAQPPATSFQSFGDFMKERLAERRGQEQQALQQVRIAEVNPGSQVAPEPAQNSPAAQYDSYQQSRLAEAQQAAQQPGDMPGVVPIAPPGRTLPFGLTEAALQGLNPLKGTSPLAGVRPAGVEQGQAMAQATFQRNADDAAQAQEEFRLQRARQLQDLTANPTHLAVAIAEGRVLPDELAAFETMPFAELAQLAAEPNSKYADLLPIAQTGLTDADAGRAALLDHVTKRETMAYDVQRGTKTGLSTLPTFLVGGQEMEVPPQTGPGMAAHFAGSVAAQLPLVYGAATVAGVPAGVAVARAVPSLAGEGVAARAGLSAVQTGATGLALEGTKQALKGITRPGQFDAGEAVKQILSTAGEYALFGPAYEVTGAAGKAVTDKIPAIGRAAQTAAKAAPQTTKVVGGTAQGAVAGSLAGAVKATGEALATPERTDAKNFVQTVLKNAKEEAAENLVEAVVLGIVRKFVPMEADAVLQTVRTLKQRHKTTNSEEPIPAPGTVPADPSVSEAARTASSASQPTQEAPGLVSEGSVPDSHTGATQRTAQAPIDRAEILRQANPGMDEGAIQEIVRTTADLPDSGFPAFAQRMGKPEQAQAEEQPTPTEFAGQSGTSTFGKGDRVFWTNAKTGQRREGTVVAVNEKTGFAFIQPDGTGKAGDRAQVKIGDLGRVEASASPTQSEPATKQGPAFAPTPATETLGLASTGRKASKPATVGQQVVAGSATATTTSANDDLPRLTPTATKEIEKILSKGLRTVLRTGRLVLKGAAGEFSLKSGTGKVQRQHAGAWRVVGHELGHAFSKATGFEGVQSELNQLALKYYPAPERIPKGREALEGMAEFLQMWVVDPQRMRKEAPQTTEAFEGFLGENPEIAGMFDRARAIAVHDLSGTPLERVGRTIAPPGTKIEGARSSGGLPSPGPAKEGEYKLPWFKRIIFEPLDYTIPLKDLHQAAVEQGYKGLDPAKIAAVSGQAREKARMDFTDKPRDEAGRFVVPDRRPLQQIVEDADKTPGGVTLLDNIIHALRYKERYERGFADAPISKKEAEAAVAQAEQEHPELTKLAKEYTETLSEIVLTKLTKAGLLSNAAAERVRKGSSFYIPLYHVGRRGGGSSGQRAAGQPVKRYEGSSEEVVDFLTATIAKLNEVEHAIEFNRVLNSVADAIEQENMGLFGEIIPRPIVARQVGVKNLEGQLQKLLGDDLDISDQDRAVRMFFMGGIQDVGGAEPIVMARRGDDVRFIRLAPDLYRSIQSMAPVDVDLAVKVAAGFSQFFRLGKLLTPTYVWNAAARDILGSRIQTEAPERSMTLGYMAGLAKAAGFDPDLISLYIQSGAYGSAAQEALNSMLRSRADSGLRPTGAPNWMRTAKGMFIRVVESPIELLRIMEEAPRIAEFEAVLRQELKGIGLTVQDVKDGKIPEELSAQVESALLDAAYSSREVVANFSLHGAYRPLRKYMRAVTFLQGGSQGVYRAARQFAAKPGLTMLRIALWLGPLAVAAWWRSRKSKWYADKTSEERDRYFLFPIGDAEDPLFWVGLAKPYDYAVPINIGERFLDWAFTNHPNRRKPTDDLDSIVEQAVGLPLVPPWWRLYVQLKSNMTDTGAPIVPRSEQGLPTELQYGPGSSKLAIQVNHLLTRLLGKDAPSPRKIDFAGREAGGAFYSGLTASTNRLLPDSWPGAEPRTGLEYAPVVGGILRGPAEGGSRITERFYGDYGRAQELDKGAKEWARRKASPIRKLTDQDLALVKALPAMKAISDDLADIRKVVREKEADRAVSPEEQRMYLLRLKWYERAAAGYLYGQEPPPPPRETRWTEVHVSDMLQHFETITRQALEREVRREGGPSESVKFLEQFVKK